MTLWDESFDVRKLETDIWLNFLNHEKFNLSRFTFGYILIKPIYELQRFNGQYDSEHCAYSKLGYELKLTRKL